MRPGGLRLTVTLLAPPRLTMTLPERRNEIPPYDILSSMTELSPSFISSPRVKPSPSESESWF